MKYLKKLIRAINNITDFLWLLALGLTLFLAPFALLAITSWAIYDLLRKNNQFR